MRGGSLDMAHAVRLGFYYRPFNIEGWTSDRFLLRYLRCVLLQKLLYRRHWDLLEMGFAFSH